MQLARLRAAWFESMQAMNKLKEFMVSQNKELAKAFHWTNASLPSKFKTDSVSYYQAVEVALISALMFGAAIFFLQQAFFTISLISWIISILSGTLTIYTQLIIYKRALK